MDSVILILRPFRRRQTIDRPQNRWSSCMAVSCGIRSCRIFLSRCDTGLTHKDFHTTPGDDGGLQMELTGLVIEKIIQMFLVLIVGAVIRKIGILNDDSTKRLSDLVLLVVTPFLIVDSFAIDFDSTLLYGFTWAFIAGFVTMVLTIGLSHLFIDPPLVGRKGRPVDKESGRTAIERYTLVYTNCGFIGIPLIGGVIGQRGIFYMTAYFVAFNILMWSHGVILMGNVRLKIGAVLRSLVTPAVISIILGLIVFLFKIQVPTVVHETVKMVSSLNTPVAMIIAGSSLAGSKALRALKQWRIWYISFLKLFIFPLLCLLVIRLMGLDFEPGFTVFIAAACPAGATVIMFTNRYSKDVQLATGIFVVTTLISMISIPLLTPLAVHLLG